MKTLIKFLIMNAFILLVFIFSGCEQITQPISETGLNSLQKAFETRPIKGIFIYTSPTQINDSVFAYTATGNASHLGNCTVLDTVIYHYTPTGVTVDGTDWITVANGSIIHMTWFMDLNNPSTWVWEFVSGTGRFAGVIGNGTFTTEMTGSGDLIVTFLGTITY